MEKLINFLLRVVMSVIAMFFINLFLERAGISVAVGINPHTVLTSGILGFPGLLALYGFRIYSAL